MIAKRIVDIYAIVHDGLYADYRVYPDGRVHTWAYGAIRWVDLDKDHPNYEAIRDAGLKAINEE